MSVADRVTSRLVAKILLLTFLAACGGCESRTDAKISTELAKQPPGGTRIVTLAPHLAELVFAVGAGEQLVGVTAYTDYPKAAAALPLVGDAFAIDQEQLALLKPDLLLAWNSGTAAHVVDELETRGYRVEPVETRGIGDISTALERIGELTGHASEAAVAAEEFRRGMQQLAERHRESQPISVFYQVSGRPLYTVNGEHYVSELIEVCGGRNVFDDLNNLAPLVDVEAVLARNPEVMLASDDSEAEAFDVWRRWPELAANRHANFFFLPADEIGRATPRLLRAGETLCETLDQARRNRGSG
ncbi:MAG TPA: helical backbone metal receptor [Woeseiaceae bacterium]|nr:helical backbone metal receptor [Woeseiaceae bacterium]